ncbi:MAG: DUF418 domain-containing protein [Bacteroidota bacterium]
MVQVESARKSHIDFLRGIAMIGVIFANFNSYLEQQLPFELLNESANRIDHFLMSFNSIFLEWKFMSLFSILFGYGFGVILLSAEKAGEKPSAFFLRRMTWLFLLGIIHTFFWLGDVLHLYAICGVLLLSFRKISTKTLLPLGLALTVGPSLVMAIIKTCYNFGHNDHLAYDIYAGLISNNLLTLFCANSHGYYDTFIITGSEWHDIPETLGRFLLGYWLLKSNAIESYIASPEKLNKLLYQLSIPVLLYWILRGLLLSDSSFIPQSPFISPFIKIGILLNTVFYATLALMIYSKHKNNKPVDLIVNLGKMTLTNYLSVSALMILTLYGIGLGLLPSIHIYQLWLMAVVWTALLMFFSNQWLSNHRYGPAEWIWRQLSWMKRISNKK